MTQKAFYTTAGTVFLIVGVVHLLRVVNGWPVSVSEYAVPMWFSWVAVLLTGYLSYYSLFRRR